MQPRLLARKLREPPAVLTVDHSGIDSGEEFAFHPYPAPWRFDPHPIAILYAQFGCCFRVDLHQRMRVPAADGINLTMLGVEVDSNSAPCAQHQRIFLGQLGLADGAFVRLLKVWQWIVSQLFQDGAM